jgi:hypothetical protein
MFRAFIENRAFQAYIAVMGKVKIKTAKKKAKRTASFVYRGVLIRPPHVAPDTPLAKIERGAKAAVQRYFNELAAAE